MLLRGKARKGSACVLRAFPAFCGKGGKKLGSVRPCDLRSNSRVASAPAPPLLLLPTVSQYLPIMAAEKKRPRNISGFKSCCLPQNVRRITEGNAALGMISTAVRVTVTICPSWHDALQRLPKMSAKLNPIRDFECTS